MANIEKKIKKLKSRLKEVEDEMYLNLKQKTSNTAEISISDYQRKIFELKTKLNLLQS